MGFMIEFDIVKLTVFALGVVAMCSSFLLFDNRSAFGVVNASKNLFGASRTAAPVSAFHTKDTHFAEAAPAVEEESASVSLIFYHSLDSNR